MKVKRRDFIRLTTLAGVGLTLTSTKAISSCTPNKSNAHSLEYKALIFELLKEWCDGMIKTQIVAPSDTAVHGMFNCPACNHIHARVMDAVYPFFYMAKTTGEKKYLEAGIAAFGWGKNVTREDGAWTNELSPKSWDGTTVFGAVALAETLHFHGDLLDKQRRDKWYKRLASAADFVYHRFNVIGNANINYGATTLYALNLIGKLLDKPAYLKRSKELAEQFKRYFTSPNHFIFGEIQGRNKNRLSDKGLHGIDLGYNVEESLNNLVLYALQEKDEELLELVKKSLETHLDFIIPDGGVDNGFGTRMYKWSYWGSRTSDGMQQAFGMMASHNPALGTAAFKNAELLKLCTHDGLLHGGLHYVSHGIKPCVHHTFAHAKPFAAMLDHWEHLPKINKSAPLPRAVAKGIKYFEELDVSLFALGDWRGTISANDAVYNPQNDCRQATGASLSLLYHNKVGLLCAASMAVYKMKEAYNQQPAPGEDIALTPRIETFRDKAWYTNLYDLAATFSSSENSRSLEYVANVQLKNEAREVIGETASDFTLNYSCVKEKMEIVAKTHQKIQQPTAIVLPVVSPTGELVTQEADNILTIEKPEGKVKLSSNVTLRLKKMPKSRTFNMVPGVEAIPVVANFEEGKKDVRIRIEIL